MKTCSRCGVEQPIDQFFRNYGRPTSWCKACYKQSNQAWHSRNKRTRTEYQVIYNRARRLGMTYAEYLALGEDPGKQCAICEASPDDVRNGSWSNGQEQRRRRLAIDHSHTGGQRRGFLCQSCNQALGMAGDSPELLRKMADYLEKGAEFPVLGTYKSRPVIFRRESGRGGPQTSVFVACSVEGCGQPVHARGLCGTHYARLERTGTTADPPRSPETCSIEGCDRPYRTSGYCALHYKRFKRLGDATAGWVAPSQAVTHCQTCGQELKSYRTTQRFCSKKCRNTWHQQALRARLKGEGPDGQDRRTPVTSA